jgi:hypothetical protein
MKDGYYWMETPCNPLEVVQVQDGKLWSMGNTRPLLRVDGEWTYHGGPPVEVRQLIGPIEPPFLTGHERQRDAR